MFLKWCIFFIFFFIATKLLHFINYCSDRLKNIIFTYIDIKYEILCITAYSYVMHVSA